MALYKSVGLALRSASWNGDAHAAVMLDAQEVTARAAMTDEIDRCDRPVVCRCDGAIAGRCKGPDAGRCDRTIACRCARPGASRCGSTLAGRLPSPKPRSGADRCARIVNERQTELHD